jgi:hypothetical protein
MRIGRASMAFALVSALAAPGCGSSTADTMFPDPDRTSTGGAGGSTGGSGGAGGTGGTTTAGSGGTAPATGGSGGASTGSGGSATAGTGGSSGGAGGTGASGSGGATGTGGSGPAAGSCPANATFGMRVVMEVTWPSTTAAAAGMGRITTWNRTSLGASGDALEGMLRGCGTVLPETSLTALGRIAAGGDKILIEVPNEVWDKPSMPSFVARGKQSAPGPAASVTLEWATLVGIDFPDPRAAWPASYTGLTGVDADGDGKPGYTARPRGMDGYVLPPTSVGIGGSAPAAEQLFLVSRHLVAVTAMRPSCDEMSGPANVTAFDSHVMGCVVRGGADCTRSQTDFVDGNRMKYVVKSATFAAKKLPDDATCADVRAALPAP